MRCTACGYEWYQDSIGDEEDLADTGGIPARPLPPSHPSYEDKSGQEPIPDAVRPRPRAGDSDVPAIRKRDEDEKMDASAKAAAAGASLAGYGLSVFVVLALTGALAWFREPVVKLWPPAAGLYEMAGMPVAVPGEGLIIDGLHAVAETNEGGVVVLGIEGNIVNMTGAAISVPPLRATLRREDGSTFDSWQFDPPQVTISGFGEAHFHTSYPGLPQDVKEVNVKLVLVSAPVETKEAKPESKPEAEIEHEADAPSESVSPPVPEIQAEPDSHVDASEPATAEHH